MEILAAGGGCSGGGSRWNLGTGFMGTSNPGRDGPGTDNYAKPYKYIEYRTIADTPPKSGLFGVTATTGSVHCLEYRLSPDKVDKNTCAQMARDGNMLVEDFYAVNRGLKVNCKNILPMTRYCVRGFVEPRRAWDGKCGPNHNNATCLGTTKTCCNSETWTCGDNIEDCAPGTCYEGTCHGHLVYSIDGLCGAQHGYRGCAGKWGNCCSAEGKCGSGPEFCGTGCQSGVCDTRPPRQMPILEELRSVSWTTFCGGEGRERCPGTMPCCNKDGRCGSHVKDCTVGCQPEFGKCGAEAFHIPVPYLEQYLGEAFDDIPYLKKYSTGATSDQTPPHDEL